MQKTPVRRKQEIGSFLGHNPRLLTMRKTVVFCMESIHPLLTNWEVMPGGDSETPSWMSLSLSGAPPCISRLSGVSAACEVACTPGAGWEKGGSAPARRPRVGKRGLPGTQNLAHRVPRQATVPCNRLDRLLIDNMVPSNLGNRLHYQHPPDTPMLKTISIRQKARGSILDADNPR